MFVAAIALEQHALSLHLPIGAKFENLDVLTDEETEDHDEQTETDGSQSCTTSRDPYNQYQKCTQFSAASLVWPDR